MNGFVKGVLSATAVIVAVGAGAGGWYAWEMGLVGSNPRAPTPENFASAIQREWWRATLSAPRPCLRVQALSERSAYLQGRDGVVAEGVDGVRNSLANGTFGVVLTDEIGGEGSRIRSEQMMALAGAGLATVKDTTFVDPSGTERRAKAFSLTRTGWIEASGRLNCLNPPKREFSRVIKHARMEGSEPQVFEVVFEAKPKAAPAWGKDPGLFQGLDEYMKPVTETARLVRTESGWAVRFRKRDNRDPARVEFEESDADQLSVRPTVAEAQALVRTAMQAQGRGRSACLMLNVRSDGQVVPGGMQDRASYTFYDKATERNPDELRAIGAGLKLMQALEKASIAKAQPAEFVADGTVAHAGGVVYEIEQKFSILMDPAQQGCLSYGRLQYDVSLVRDHVTQPPRMGEQETIEFYGTVKAVEPAQWIKETGVDQSIPIVKLMLESGVGFHGVLVNQKKAGWKFGGMIPELPSMAYPSPREAKALLATLPRVGESEVASTAKTEAHAVLVYEAKNGRHGPATPRVAGTIDILVTRTKLPVDLLVSSYEPVKWLVKLEPGARLNRVFVYGYHPQDLGGIPAGVKVVDGRAVTPGDNLQAAQRRAISHGVDANRLYPVLRREVGPESTLRSVQRDYSGVAFRVGDIAQLSRPQASLPVPMTSDARMGTIAIPPGGVVRMPDGRSAGSSSLGAPQGLKPAVR